jgi:hypothetical protein
MLKKTAIALALFLCAAAVPVRADDLSDGRAILFNNGNPTWDTVAQANNKFRSYLDANPNTTRPEAYLFRAATRMAVFFVASGLDTGSMDSGQEFLQACGATRLHPDNLEEFPFEESSKYDDLWFPETAPDGEDLRALLAGPFINYINGSLSNLDSIINGTGPGFGQNFHLILTAAELDADQDMEVDFGDVLAFKAALLALRAFARIVTAYNLDISLEEFVSLMNADVLSLQRDLLDVYPDLLKPLSTATTNMADARQNVLNAIDAYLAASQFIRSETDPQGNDLVSLDPESAGDEENLRNGLIEAKNSLNGDRPMEIKNDDGVTETRVNLNALFGGTTNSPNLLNIRSVLPPFSQTNHIRHGTFPDVDMNGILPDVASEENLVEVFEIDLLPVYFDVPTNLTGVTIDGNESEWGGVPAVTPPYFECWFEDWEVEDSPFEYVKAMDTPGEYPVNLLVKLKEDRLPENKYAYMLILFTKRGWVRIQLNPDGLWENQAAYMADSASGAHRESDAGGGDFAINGRVIEARSQSMGLQGGFLGVRLVFVTKDQNEIETWRVFNSDPLYLSPVGAATGTVSCAECGRGPIIIYAYGGQPFGENTLMRTTVAHNGAFTMAGLPIGPEIWFVARWAASENGVMGPGDLKGGTGPHQWPSSMSKALPAIPLTTRAVWTFEKTQGDNQTGIPGLPLPWELMARLVNDYGTGADGYPVDWSVTQGGGSLWRDESWTWGGNGEAGNGLTLGATPGPAQVTASVREMPLSVTFNAEGVNRPVITTEALPDGFANSPYDFQMVAAGGAFPYTWTVSNGSLPAGWTMSPSGRITGDNSTSGIFGFDLMATDTLGATDSRSYTLTVHPTWRVTGQVLSAPGVPLSGAKVQLMFYPWTFAITNPQGAFEFWCKEGDQVVRLSADGYMSEDLAFHVAQQDTWIGTPILTPPPPDCGWDVDGNHRLTQAEVLHYLQVVAGITNGPMDPGAPCAWDVDGDRQVTMADVVAYIQTLADTAP